jgi:hypothetical protein
MPRGLGKLNADDRAIDMIRSAMTTTEQALLAASARFLFQQI